MKKTKNNLFKNKVVKFVVMPFLLLALWFSLTFLYIIHLDTAFSLISYVLPNSVFTHVTYQKLEKGDYIEGEFRASENNLGILSLRFETFFRPAYQNEDKLLFQIKEKGDKNWYYQNTYRDGLIYDVPFFPFGFPIIKDSLGKTYEFKITSLRGDNNNSVALSSRWQNIAAKYKFNKNEILGSRFGIFKFSIRKFFISFLSIDVLFSSFIYFLPLFFYLLLLSPLGKYIQRPFLFLERKLFDLDKVVKSSRTTSIIFSDFILLGAVLLDGFYLQLGNDFVYLLIPILWIIIQRYFGFTSKKTFIIGISFLLFPPIFLQFNLGQIALNLAVWAYLFLCAGLIQAMMELKE